MDNEAKRSADGLYVGPESVFQRAGFTEVARQKPGRPLMRFAFRGPAGRGFAPGRCQA
jgi:hypothetical protein